MVRVGEYSSNVPSMSKKKKAVKKVAKAKVAKKVAGAKASPRASAMAVKKANKNARFKR